MEQVTKFDSGECKEFEDRIQEQFSCPKLHDILPDPIVLDKSSGLDCTYHSRAFVFKEM